jgi:hypothetical protein
MSSRMKMMWLRWFAISKSWTDTIRHTTLDKVDLSYGFIGSDLACYAAGIGMGILIELTVCIPKGVMYDVHELERARR